MTQGVKIAIIIGGTLTIIGGGVGIYLLTRCKKTNTGTSGSTSSTSGSTNSTNEKIDKVTGTINSSVGLFGALKDLTQTTGVSNLFGNKKVKSIDGTEINLKGAKEEKHDNGSITYTLADGTEVFMNKYGQYEIIEDEDIWGATGEKYNALAMSKSEAKKKMSISKNGVFNIK